MNSFDDKLDRLHQRVDQGFTRLESKIDKYALTTAEHSQQIKYIQGAVKVIITLMIAGAGFFATAYFNSLKEPSHGIRINETNPAASLPASARGG
jgi:hypothetical protein